MYMLIHAKIPEWSRTLKYLSKGIWRPLKVREHGMKTQGRRAETGFAGCWLPSFKFPAMSGPVSSLQTHPSTLIGITQKHGTLDLVFYYFLFCFKAICLIFTYKNIYMVHFLFTISSSWHLKVLVGVGNAQPIFGYRWSFLFSCPLPTSIVGGFPWNVSSLNTTWLQIPKGISQKEEEEVGLSLLSP